MASDDRMPKKFRGPNGNGRDGDLCQANNSGRVKVTYRSKAKAKQAAIAGNSNPRLYPYLCWGCGQWHLTHHKQTYRQRHAEAPDF
jgi:hypothetical protein